LTPDHAALVRASWPAIAAKADTLTTSFYAHLFEIDDSAAMLFADVDMAAQRRKLVQSLGIVVQSVDDLDRLLPVLAALGKRHTTYGIEDRHFDSVGQALLMAFATTLGAGFTREIHDAWSEAYALIAAVMRRALIRASGATVD